MGLGVRLALGGVLFSGVLKPSTGGAGGPQHRLLSALPSDAAAAAAAGGAAEAAARGLVPSLSGISSEPQQQGSRRAGQAATPAVTGALSLAATGGRGGAAHASHW